jgi:hypothetical protein
MAFERSAPPKEAVASAVDDGRVVHVDDARGRQQKPCCGIDAAAQRAEPARVGHGVVIEKRDEPTVRLARAGVVATGKPTVLGERDHADRRKPRAHELDSAVGRRIVDEDHLSVDFLLRGHRLKTRLEVLSAVPCDDDNGDLRQHGDTRRASDGRCGPT